VENALIPAPSPRGKRCGRALIARVVRPVDQEWRGSLPVFPALRSCACAPYAALEVCRFHASVFSLEIPEASLGSPSTASADRFCGLEPPSQLPLLRRWPARGAALGHGWCLREGASPPTGQLSPTGRQRCAGVPERWRIMHGSAAHALRSRRTGLQLAMVGGGGLSHG